MIIVPVEDRYAGHHEVVRSHDTGVLHRGDGVGVEETAVDDGYAHTLTAETRLMQRQAI